MTEEEKVQVLSTVTKINSAMMKSPDSHLMSQLSATGRVGSDCSMQCQTRPQLAVHNRAALLSQQQVGNDAARLQAAGPLLESNGPCFRRTA